LKVERERRDWSVYWKERVSLSSALGDGRGGGGGCVRDERGRENGGRGQGVKGNGGHVAGSGNLNWNKTCLGPTQSTVMTVRGRERE